MPVRSPFVRTWRPAISTWAPVALHACYWLVVLVSFRENVAVAQTPPGQGVRAHVQEWKGAAAGPSDIAIVGEVAQPGVYRLSQANLTLGTLLTQAGGTTQAATGHVKITRNGRSVQQFMLSNSASEAVLAGDVVIIEGPPTRANRQAPRPVQLTLLGIIERPVVVKLSAENARIDVLVELLGQAPDVARAARLIGRPASPATAALPAQLATGNILVFNPRAIDAGRLPGFPAVIETPATTAITPDLQMTATSKLPPGFTPIPPLHTTTVAQVVVENAVADVSATTSLPGGVGQTVSASNPASIVGPAGSTWLAGTGPQAEPAPSADPFTIPTAADAATAEQPGIHPPRLGSLSAASSSNSEAVFAGASPEQMTVPATAPLTVNNSGRPAGSPLASSNPIESNLVDSDLNLSLDEELTDPPLELEAELEGDTNATPITNEATSGLGVAQWTTLFLAIGMVLGGGWLLSRWTNREAALANPSRRSLTRTRSQNSSLRQTEPLAEQPIKTGLNELPTTPEPVRQHISMEHLPPEEGGSRADGAAASSDTILASCRPTDSTPADTYSVHAAPEQTDAAATASRQALVPEVPPILPFAEILKQPVENGVVQTTPLVVTTQDTEAIVPDVQAQLAPPVPALPASLLPLMPELPQSASAQSAGATTRIERLMRNELPQDISAVSLPATIELSGEPQFGRVLRIDAAAPRLVPESSEHGEVLPTTNVAGPHFTVRAPVSRGNSWANSEVPDHSDHSDDVQPLPQRPLGNTVAARHSSRLVQALAQLQEARQ